MKLVLFLSVVIISVSCKRLKPVEEIYDSITTIEYSNCYDKGGRLTDVSICEKMSMYMDGKYTLAHTLNRIQKYKYLDDGVCEITEISDLIPQELYVSRIGEMSEEYYRINGADTTDFYFSTFTDLAKSRYKYIRKKRMHSGSPITDFEINENNEIWYYYDGKGGNVKIVDQDFKTKNITETYFFTGISYSKALNLVPVSKFGQKIVCRFEKASGDSILTYTYTDGVMSACVKKYKQNSKMVEAHFEADNKLIYTNTKFRENDLDVEVIEMPHEGMIDSTYYFSDKKVRYVSILPDSKKITTFVYDEKGNITNEVCKSKTNVKISDEELDGLIRQYQNQMN